MILLSGKEVGQAIEARVGEALATLKNGGVEPRLACILVGDNPESQSYVGRKLVAAERLGIGSLDLHLPAAISQTELDAQISALNENPAVHGILCQLPLPPHLDAARVAARIDPLKDVDCFHPYNFGLLVQGTPRFTPCTPAAILAMLDHYRIPVAGRHVVVLGRSNMVGRPLSLLLSQKGRDATVTVCHSRTRDLEQQARRADILLSAIGRPAWVGSAMVRPRRRGDRRGGEPDRRCQPPPRLSPLRGRGLRRRGAPRLGHHPRTGRGGAPDGEHADAQYGTRRFPAP